MKNIPRRGRQLKDKTDEQTKQGDSRDEERERERSTYRGSVGRLHCTIVSMSRMHLELNDDDCDDDYDSQVVCILIHQ